MFFVNLVIFFENVWTQMYRVSSFPFSNFGYFNFIKFCEDGHQRMMKIGWIKPQKSWIWISYRSTNMKWKFGKSYTLFYFQVRESPAPLNIPTPTPAPYRNLQKTNTAQKQKARVETCEHMAKTTPIKIKNMSSMLLLFSTQRVETSQRLSLGVVVYVYVYIQVDGSGIQNIAVK